MTVTEAKLQKAIDDINEDIRLAARNRDNSDYKYYTGVALGRIATMRDLGLIDIEKALYLQQQLEATYYA